ncbi:hypothetical protein ID866_2710 [Astraeus odoratus]|nr:hypothetical protein ID866_2710 [Astraeus odoratus]
MSLALVLVTSLSLSPSLASAFSFTFTSQPQQCANLSFTITGSGTPPYSVLIIPYGPSPLANNVEARTIVYQEFPDNSTSVSFQLKYPTNSQFVAVVSDSTGFGTGGTSVAANVMGTSDSSCYNSTETVSPDFPFNIDPPNQVVQCSASRLWWDPSNVQGNVNFQGVIPGGQSFSIPVGTLTNVTGEGTGFDWTPSVRAGSTLLIVAGDGRGLGSGGSGLYNVAAGLYPNSSCLTSTSPSSTAGPPAGGSYPTDTSGDQTPGDSSSSSNVGAIVGGTIGGLALLALLVLGGLYVIRRRTKRSVKERPVDLLHGDPDDSDHVPPPDLPEYRPEPFLATEPTEASSAFTPDEVGRMSFTGSRYGTHSDRRQSALTLSELQFTRSGTPDREMLSVPGPSGSMASSRKSPMPRQLRPVNIIQHEDAGPQEDADASQPETIELPPAYTNIRKAT